MRIDSALLGNHGYTLGCKRTGILEVLAVIARFSGGRLNPENRPRQIGSMWLVLALFIYGAVLTLVGVWLAGGRHGTYVLLGLAGSPFCVFGIPAAVAASLFQWGSLMAAVRMFRINARLMALYLVIHYAVAIDVLTARGSAFSDWDYVTQLPVGHWAILVLGMSIYFIGQATIWGGMIRPAAPR